MIKEQYYKILSVVSDWVLDTDHIRMTQGKIKNGQVKHEPPEGGAYPVVLAPKPQETFCDWCETFVETPNSKFFTRNIDAGNWQGKCQDCGKKQIILDPVK